MNAVQNQVRELVNVELAAANEKFPQFHSPHEGWAVMLEEIDEAEQVMQTVRVCSGILWEHYIRRNDSGVKEVESIKEYAIQLACEAIQIGAMAQKNLDMLDKENLI